MRAIVAALVFALVAVAPSVGRAAPAWGSSAIVQREGRPVFTVDGKPFFVFGGAFFYERLPQSLWEPSLRAYRSLGINTLDLYVPWNWHELADGDFDFTGRTSPRRDLHTVMALARRYGFKIILRPGPVIRNEWRNGGYPAWLLQRPEYGMPLHDLLEGRYPPTATLQNAYSDDAAAEWMHNATHLHYAQRWLVRVLEEFAPVSDLVIAVQLDDDQGAYIDNQTWPAPNLAAYLGWLRDVDHSVTGQAEPVFINTYEMKVPASSPVWAWGNWYQSDAYSIAEHDRAEFEFATGLLQTQPSVPLMLSEFQAGWLEQPDDIRPRPADPTNTRLALGTAIGMGARGIVDFPPQDTLNPSGMEAPFANAFYAWDAALPLDPTRPGALPGRYATTQQIGRIVAAFGPELAASAVVPDAAIAYLTSAYDTPSNEDVSAIADRTLETQRACRNLSLTCQLVDLRYIDDAALDAYPVLFVPRPPGSLGRAAYVAAVQDRILRYAAHGGVVVRLPGVLTDRVASGAMFSAHHTPVISRVPGATFARATDGTARGFLVIPNYTDKVADIGPFIVTLRPDAQMELKRTLIQPRDVLIEPISADPKLPAPNMVAHLDPMPSPAATTAVNALPIRGDVMLPVVPPRFAPIGTPVGTGSSVAYEEDVYGEGASAIVLENALVRIVIAPNAGGRGFVFEDKRTGRSVFTTVGAMRDDVKIEPPLSTTDKIAKYTHQFPAGMFNRPYQAETLSSGTRAAVRLTYAAPDVVPQGATFTRTLTLDRESRSFAMDESVAFGGSPIETEGQRAVSVTSLAVGKTPAPANGATPALQTVVLTPEPVAFAPLQTLPVTGNALGYYDRATGDLATIAWRPADIESATVLTRQYSLVTRLTLAPAVTAHIVYGYTNAPSLAAARAKLATAAAGAQGF
jgi:hypothetical protein